MNWFEFFFFFTTIDKEVLQQILISLIGTFLVWGIDYYNHPIKVHQMSYFKTLLNYGTPLSNYRVFKTNWCLYWLYTPWHFVYFHASSFCVLIYWTKMHVLLSSKHLLQLANAVDSLYYVITLFCNSPVSKSKQLAEK